MMKKLSIIWVFFLILPVAIFTQHSAVYGASAASTGDLPLIPFGELRFDEGKKLGGGTYGDVYAGVWEHGGQVAIKRIKADIPPGELTQEIEREARIMRQLGSTPFIVQLHGLSWKNRRCSLVMELMPKGSLYDLLHNGQELPWEIRYSIAMDIAHGIDLLHSRNIIHCDLKSQNILLNEHLRAKLSDFGLSKIRAHTSTTTHSAATAGGTFEWMAPELFGLRPKHTKASDMYAFAIMCWEIASRDVPYRGAARGAVISALSRGEREEIPADCPEQFAKQVIQTCWDGNPAARPSAQDIKTRLKEIIGAWRAGPGPIIKVWEFQDDLRPVLNHGERYRLVDAPAGRRDVQKVVDAYRRKPVPGMDIAKVQIIYNPEFDKGFSSRLRKLQGRYKNSAFEAAWKTQEPDSAKLMQRVKVTSTLESMVNHKDPEAHAVNILLMWHGTKRNVLDSLFTSGYANLATTDPGFFGKAIYNAYEAEYSHRVYGPGKHGSNGALIVNWVSWYSAYPVIDGDMPRLKNGSNYANHDAHFVPVKPASTSASEENYYPCGSSDVAVYHELVVFEESQCNPRYLVELQPSLPRSVPEYPDLLKELEKLEKQERVKQQKTAIKEHAATLQKIAFTERREIFIIHESQARETLTLSFQQDYRQKIKNLREQFEKTKPVPAIPRPSITAMVIPEIAKGHEEVYQRFFNGALIYKKGQPDEVILPIAQLANPLEGTFDLSRCGDSEQYLSISTGYRKALNLANTDKVEIWFAPRFLIKKNLSKLGVFWGSASHFKSIMNEWDAATAPVGIFWTWGEWDDTHWYHYLTNSSMDVLGWEDLYEKYKKAQKSSQVFLSYRAYSINDHFGWFPHIRLLTKFFHISFVN